MSNFNYKNIDEIINDNTPGFGETVPPTQYGLLEKVPVVPALYNANNVEFHAFLINLALVGSSYEINTFSQDTNDNGDKTVRLNVHRDLENLQLPSNYYKVVYNFHKDYIGSKNSSDKLFISEISDDRLELKLSLTNPNSLKSRGELANFVIEFFKPKEFFPPILLNFGENRLVDIVNITSTGDPSFLYVKLMEPLPFDFDKYFNCWVSVRVMRPYIDTIFLTAEPEVFQPTELSGPNFEVDYDYWVTSETNYKSWTDILSQNVQTSDQILQRYLSSSNATVQLNIDYGEFKNFIYYSNAKDRVDNFFVKMELVESYNSGINQLNQYSSSMTSNNKVKLKMLKDQLISGFDGFEKYLYYSTSGSIFYTKQISSSIQPFPKYEVSPTSSTFDVNTNQGYYNFYSVTSSVVFDWFNNLLDIADDYDAKNYSALAKALPDHITDDSENQEAVHFVNMLGQHFDIMYLYTDHILKKNLRVENPKDGMSQDLIYDVTRNMGWTLTHGSSAKDLWEYALGLSGSGEPVWTGKTSVRKDLVKSYEERTKEVWRRILNNLPYIYKTKGTARSVRALLAAYGVPQTLLTIREFGGPDNADLGIIPRTEWEKHSYYFNFFGSLPVPTVSRYIYVPWEKIHNPTGSWQYPDTVTFRWKMEPESSYKYLGNSRQTLLQKQSGSRVDWFVTMDKNSGTDEGKGTVTFWLGDGTNYTSASIYDDYFYDDIPVNLMIRRQYSNDSTSSNQRYDFIVKTGKYGKLVIEKSGSIIVTGSVSGSYNEAWSSDGTLFIGSGSNIYTNNILSGSVYELRYWGTQLYEPAFNNHVLAPRAYNSNTSTSSFYDLQAQWKFWQPFDVAATTSMSSTHPDQTKTSFYSSSKNAIFYNFTSESFESITENYNMEVATVGNNTPFAEKIRIDSGSLIGGLSIDQSSEVSKFDKFSVDSNKLMVAFSPQSIINEDIYEAIGYTSIDDYFGEYSNIDKDEYPRLKWFAREYWQKYPNKNDFTAYIKLISAFDFSLFDQIRQVLPARVNEIIGLVIEPNVLERSKVRVVRNFSGESHEKSIRRTNEISSSGTPSISISSKKTTIFIGFDNDSSYQEIDGESDIPLEIESSHDTNVGGDFDPVIIPTGFTKKYQINISSSRGDNFANFVQNTFRPYKSTLQMKTGSIASYFKQYVIDVRNRNYGKLIGSISSGMGTGLSNVFASFDSSFSTTYIRTNVSFSSGSGDVGYGLQWTGSINDSSKFTALFDTIQGYRTDSYYSAYKFFYTSSKDMSERNYFSYTLVSASYENPYNLSAPIRNHRFDGCKLTGPDINVESRNTPDGKPVVEVFIVDPNQINTNQNFTGTGI